MRRPCTRQDVTRLLRSGAVLSATALFSSSAIRTYAAFAWLPDILEDVAGATPTEACVFLAIACVISVPGVLIAPCSWRDSETSADSSTPASRALPIAYLGLLPTPALLTLIWVPLIDGDFILFPARLAPQQDTRQNVRLELICQPA